MDTFVTCLALVLMIATVTTVIMTVIDGVRCYKKIKQDPKQVLYSPEKLARLEHENLSPEFMTWAAEMGDIDHPATCEVCHPPRPRASEGEFYGRRCPYCNTKIVSTTREYIEHNEMCSAYYISGMSKSLARGGVKTRVEKSESERTRKYVCPFCREDLWLSESAYSGHKDFCRQAHFEAHTLGAEPVYVRKPHA